MKLTPQLAEALVNLRGNRDFETFIKGMQEDIKHHIGRAIHMDGALQTRAAGAAAALTEVVDAVNDAPAALEKFRNHK